jgi:hypothetical protein
MADGKDPKDLRDKFKKPLQRPSARGGGGAPPPPAPAPAGGGGRGVPVQRPATGPLAAPRRPGARGRPGAAAQEPEAPSRRGSAVMLPDRRPGAVAEPAPAPAEVEIPASGEGTLARLFESIAKLLAPKPEPRPTPIPAIPAEPRVFSVLVAALDNDPDGAAQDRIVAVLSNRAALKVQPVARLFTLDTMADPAHVAMVQTALRQTVVAEKGQVLIWGDVGPEGLRLRFAIGTEEERPGTFGLATRLEVPAGLGENAANMLYAAVLAAAEARTEAQKGAVRRLLPSAATRVEEVVGKPPPHMSVAQQRSMQAVFGHVALVAAQAVPPSQAPPWFEKSVTAYRGAQKRVGRGDPAWELGLLHKYAGVALVAHVDRGGKSRPDLLEQAAKEWRLAAENLAREVMPQDWAAARIRLGKTLYRLDIATGDTEMLREALAALQSALQVYSRTETPQKWAEIMHDVAQVLQVYGDQLRNPDVLRRAIETCNQVLRIVNRQSTPLAWATARNTLGSALFLLDKHTDGVAHLEEAGAALSEALEVFCAAGAKAPAQVAARNLAHVRKLAEDRRGRQIVDPDWVEGHATPRR